MYFWLNFSDRDNHVQRIPVAVKNIDLLFKSLESDKLRLFLLLYVIPSLRVCIWSYSGTHFPAFGLNTERYFLRGTIIDNNKYLQA